MSLPKAGEVLEGKVIKILKKGVIVKLPNRQTGFLHISEISSDYVKNINDYLKLRQEIKVKVINVKEKERKVSLSIRKINGEEDKKIKFEAAMNRFLKESGEKQKQIQKNIDSKRGVNKRRNNQ